MGIDQHFRTQRTAAVLTLITIGTLVTAYGTGAHDIPVCQEGPGLFIVILLAFFYFQFPPAVEIGEEFLCGLMMDGLAGAMVDVEGYSQVGKILLDDRMIFIYDGLWGRAFLHGLYGDRRAMLVT